MHRNKVYPSEVFLTVLGLIVLVIGFCIASDIERRKPECRPFGVTEWRECMDECSGSMIANMKAVGASAQDIKKANPDLSRVTVCQSQLYEKRLAAGCYTK